MEAHNSTPDGKKQPRSALFTFLALLVANGLWSCAPLPQDQQALAPVVTHSAQPAPAPLTEPPFLPMASSAGVISETDPPESITPPEPEREVAQEVARLETLGSWEEGLLQPATGDEVEYDFPVTVNKHVEFYLDYFQNQQRDQFSRWLSRSGRYVPMIQAQLRQAGLPEDLAYLPLIESGFNLTAYSSAKAVGPWQFMYGTALDYGLRVNSYVDERRDPIKSTQAAIAFLSDLHEEFGSWHLAVAAYNAGGGRIRRAVKKYDTDNFWEIAQESYLTSETKRYVPKLIAAIMIAKEPEKYGFTDIDYYEPLNYETVYVPRWTSLEAVAVACKTEIDELRDLNRELRRSITPPDSPAYALKVPFGKKELVELNLSRVQAVVTTRYKDHVVRAGDTLTRIARQYEIKKTTLLKANNLRKEQLTIGQRLRIPYQTTSYAMASKTESRPMAKSSQQHDGGDKLVLHKVKPGETIAAIAQRYNVSTGMIAAWNDLKNPNRIQAGQKLALYVEQQTAEKPGRAIAGAMIAAAEAPEANHKVTYYHVQGGDTLWSIAQKFQLDPDQIRQWNDIRGNTIHPGHRLVLRMAAGLGS